MARGRAAAPAGAVGSSTRGRAPPQGVQQQSLDSLGDAEPPASQSSSTCQLSARLGSLPGLDRQALPATAQPLSPASAAVPGRDLADHVRSDEVSAVRDSASPGSNAAPAGHAAPVPASLRSEAGAEAAGGKGGAEPPPPLGRAAMAGQTAAPGGAGLPAASSTTSWADFDALRCDRSDSVAPEQPSSSPTHSGAAETPPPDSDAAAPTSSPNPVSPRSKGAQGPRQQGPQQEGGGAGLASISGGGSASRLGAPHPQVTPLPAPSASMGTGTSGSASGLELGGEGCSAAQEGRKWWQLPRTDPRPTVAPSSAPRRLLCPPARHCSARQTASAAWAVADEF